MRTNPLRPALGLTAAMVLAFGCSADDPATTAEPATDAEPASGLTPMIVDYSPTLSDVPALMFLATHPSVDLLAVTLPGTGESDCGPGVRNTRALLAIAGHPEVPVACGPEAPMEGDRDWPLQFREAARSLSGVVLPAVTDEEPIDAVELLVDTLEAADRPVRIVTLGPLTNVGYLFEVEPGLSPKVESIVTMGGAFDVNGNVESSPDAEWNLYIDPQSVRVALESGVPITFVPLDATNFVPGGLGLFARLSATATTDSGEAVRQLWAASIETERSIAAEWWYFWDELAAVIAVDPSVAAISERSVAMEDSGATAEREEGVTALVASSADPIEFERVFLETFADGEALTLDLTSDEARYLELVRAAMVQLFATIDGAFARAEQIAPEVPADELAVGMVTELFDGMEALGEELPEVEGSNRLLPQNEALVDAIDTFLASEDEFLQVLEAAAPSESLGVDGFFEVFFEATDGADLAVSFDAFEQACRDLEFAAFAIGAVDAVCTL